MNSTIIVIMTLKYKHQIIMLTLHYKTLRLVMENINYQ